MRCTACGFENVSDASFCGECGASLTSTVSCPACGRPNPPKQKFCNGCGQALARPADRAAPPNPRSYTPKHLAEKILTSRSALEGERKQVTVLFADVKGSMELSESIDPEDWHAILERFFKILTDGVHRFEGTINQYTGDGIMALFGAPIAHEDHAQRACYAALRLQQELRRYADEIRLEHGLGFSVRMGLNSGEVVVGRIGDDLRMDYTAQGHTVGSEIDPEEWHRIMDRFFQILAEGVHRFEGTVNEYRGDGIMALFGAPIAHEDHAQPRCSESSASAFATFTRRATPSSARCSGAART